MRYRHREGTTEITKNGRGSLNGRVKDGGETVVTYVRKPAGRAEYVLLLRTKVIRAEKERKSFEGLSRGMPGKDASFAGRRQREGCAGPRGQ